MHWSEMYTVSYKVETNTDVLCRLLLQYFPDTRSPPDVYVGFNAILIQRHSTFITYSIIAKHFNVVFPGFFDSGSFKLSNITLDIQSPIMSFKFIVAGWTRKRYYLSGFSFSFNHTARKVIQHVNKKGQNSKCYV